MKYKMTVLYYSKAGNAEALARAIAREQQTKGDQIPPAYPCEAQKLLLIVLETIKAVDKQVNAFVRDLNPNRTKNVAFFCAGDDVSKLDELKSILKGNGVNVLDDVFTCQVKGGLFKAGKVSDEDIKKAVAWSNKVVDSLL